MNSFEKLEYLKHKNEIRVINISEESEIDSIEIKSGEEL